jgi:glycosidase
MAQETSIHHVTSILTCENENMESKIFYLGGINDYNDPNQVRNCWLVGLPDLRTGTAWVRDRIVDYMNDLIGIGVAGFRIDAVKVILFFRACIKD